MSEHDLTVWGAAFAAKLAETETIISECEERCQRIAALLEGARS